MTLHQLAREVHDQIFTVGNRPIVHRETQTFPLQHKARMGVDEASGRRLGVGTNGLGAQLDRITSRRAQFAAMRPGYGDRYAAQVAVEIFNCAPAHQRHAAPKPSGELRQQIRKTPVGTDVIGMPCRLHKRAIEVQEQRGTIERAQHGRRGQGKTPDVFCSYIH